MKKIWPPEVSEFSLKFKQTKTAQKNKFKIQNRAQLARAGKFPPKAPRSSWQSTWASQVDRAVDLGNPCRLPSRHGVDRAVDLAPEPGRTQPTLAGLVCVWSIF